MTTSNDPDEIRAEIERTRSRLSSNVDTLAHEAKPSTMAKRQVGKVSGTVSGLRDRVMGSAHDSASNAGDAAQSAVSSATDAVQSAPSAVRQQAQGNPLAAGLDRVRCRVGAGVADPGQRHRTTGRGGRQGQGAALAARAERGGQGRRAQPSRPCPAGRSSREGHRHRRRRHHQGGRQLRRPRRSRSRPGRHPDRAGPPRLSRWKQGHRRRTTVRALMRRPAVGGNSDWFRVFSKALRSDGDCCATSWARAVRSQRAAGLSRYGLSGW